MAEDTAAVLDAVKVDAAFVVGALLGITALTLMIHGESDRLVPAENGRISAERIPSARLTLIPHGGHILFTDQPDAAHGAMVGFLDELCPSGR